jgi:hypothetical protein
MISCAYGGVKVGTRGSLGRQERQTRSASPVLCVGGRSESLRKPRLSFMRCEIKGLFTCVVSRVACHVWCWIWSVEGMYKRAGEQAGVRYNMRVLDLAAMPEAGPVHLTRLARARKFVLCNDTDTQGRRAAALVCSATNVPHPHHLHHTYTPHQRLSTRRVTVQRRTSFRLVTSNHPIDPLPSTLSAHPSLLPLTSAWRHPPPPAAGQPTNAPAERRCCGWITSREDGRLLSLGCWWAPRALCRGGLELGLDGPPGELDVPGSQSADRRSKLLMWGNGGRQNPFSYPPPPPRLHSRAHVEDEACCRGSCRGSRRG